MSTTKRKTSLKEVLRDHNKPLEYKKHMQQIYQFKAIELQLQEINKTLKDICSVLQEI